MYCQHWSLNQWWGNCFLNFLWCLHCYSVTISCVYTICVKISPVLVYQGVMDCKMVLDSIACNVSFSEKHAFYPRPVLAFGYCHRLRLCVCLSVCVCVSLCVNHLLVRAITRDPFKLGSPNMYQRCKRTWLRSLLFLGVIDLDLQGQI